MGENPSHNQGPDLPVENVSWDDVQGFLQRLNQEVADLVGGPAEAGVAPPARPAAGSELSPALRWRLPTEAEWEFACRAGTQTAYHFGDAFDPKLANNGSATVAVRSLPPNPWGLYEMHGNVYEWCEDWFGDYPAGPVIDPVGLDTGVRRVLRGGGWLSEARSLRSAFRFKIDPGSRIGDIGFRLALGPELRQARSGRKISKQHMSVTAL